MTEDEARTQLIMDYKMTFGSPEGKRVLSHLAKITGFMDCDMPVSGGIDPYYVVARTAMRIMYANIVRYVERDLTKEQHTEADNTQE